MKLQLTQEIFDLIADSPFAIAPERAEELHQLVRKAGVKLTIGDRDNYERPLGAYVRQKHVRVGPGTLERLWAHCLFHWSLFRRLLDAGYGSKIDVHADTALLPLFELVHSARTQHPFRSRTVDLSGVPEVWYQESFEMFLAAAGWYLLHEIGHVVLEHVALDSDLAKREELEADDFASKWIMSQWRKTGDDPTVHLRRAGGQCSGCST